MSRETSQHRPPTRDKSPGPIIDLTEKIKTRLKQGDNQADLERELGIEPPSEAQPMPRSRRNGKHETAREEPQSNAILTRLSEVTPRPIHWLWPGRIPFGCLTMLDGDPGLGKSLISLDLAARVTTARPMPDGTPSDLSAPAGVLILSSEDGTENTIHPRLEAAGADLLHVAMLSGIRTVQGERLPLLTDLEDIRHALRQIAARLMIVDPLMAYLPTTVNAFRDQDIRSVLAPLAALVAELDVALLLIRHLNKMATQQALYRGGGSIGIVGASRSGLIVAHDPNESDPERHVLAPSKANLSRVAPALIYRTEETPSSALRIAWEGTSPHTARTLLEQQGENDAHSAIEEAKSFLADVLGDGPVPAKEVRQEASEAGITGRTLDRAKSRLNIKTQKRGKPGERNQHWVWILSETDSTAQKYAKKAEVRHIK